MPDRVLVEVDHPLVRHKVTLLRDVATTTRDFRQLSSEIAGMLAYEATRELELERVDVTTPLETDAGLAGVGQEGRRSCRSCGPASACSTASSR